MPTEETRAGIHHRRDQRGHRRCLGRPTVKITPDTNIWLRIITNDDPAQRSVAEAELNQAEVVVIPTVVLCELVWTLLRLYKYPRADVAVDVRRIINASNVVVNRAA